MSSEEKRPLELDVSGIIHEDKERKRSEIKKKREIRFQDYLEEVIKDPLIAQNAPSRLLEAILEHGTRPIPLEERWQTVDNKEIEIAYNLFSDQLFGLEKPVFQMVNYLKAGASRLSTGKQILLLVGPTASGKSTIANLIKKSLESYKKRPVFAIKGCPILEEPLHLLPSEKAREVGELLGIRINNDLCPVCRHMLKANFKDEDGVIRWWDVPVETFTFSIRATRGITSFEPSDEKSADVSELTGRENLGVTADPDRGYDDPQAYALNGELCRANRGVFEGRELIKADDKIMWTFISVCEEQELKVQGSGFPHIHIDTVLIGHTNLTEYKKFSNKKENEALHDRIYTVPVPYPLRIQDEVAVYRKLIETESDFSRLGDCHIAPGALEMGAMFAILTRLKDDDSQDISLLTKMKLYNGEYALTEIEERDRMPIDVRALVEAGQSAPDISKREGMDGVSSRDVLAAINIALVREGNGCLTPLTVLRSLRNLFDHRMGYADEDVDRFRDLLTASEGDSVMVEYKAFVLKVVSKAFLGAYDDLARELFRKYMKEAEFWCSSNSKFFHGQMVDIERDEITGLPKEPDERFMRSIEQFVPLDESEAKTFRGEILQRKSSFEDPKDFNYDNYPPLAKAVEKKLLGDSKESLTLVLSEDEVRDTEAKKRSKDTVDALKAAGCCRHCAKEFMEKAAEFLRE